MKFSINAWENADEGILNGNLPFCPVRDSKNSKQFEHEFVLSVPVHF